MKVKTILFALALCFAATAVVSAKTSPHMGTWNLNEAKSKFAPGAAKNTKVVYEAAGDDIKVTVDGVDGAGNATHNEWTGKFNGKFQPVTGDGILARTRPHLKEVCKRMVAKRRPRSH